jgi:3-hydroxyisobutyrate dehydrogenase-like beta-hydroxyacid dehydrogenase
VLTVAVLGLGEAGGELALGLVGAGVTVRGYDPAVAGPAGVNPCRDEADAVTGADLVLSVNSALEAGAALRRGVAAAGPNTTWADLNTASPGAKAELARVCAAHDLDFADVAIMAPVPGRGLAVPMLVSGTGAESTARLLTGVGASITVLDGPAGAAAERKLLRSVFFKGMSAAIVEALLAARAAGQEDWLRGEIAAELESCGPATVRRVVEGSLRHAVRRGAEMAAAAEMLTELGVDPLIATASRDQLAGLARTG